MTLNNHLCFLTFRLKQKLNICISISILQRNRYNTDIFKKILCAHIIIQIIFYTFTLLKNLYNL